MREKGASKEGGQGQDRKCLSKLKQDHLNQALPKETISPHNYFSAWIPTIPCLPRWTTRCRGARRAGWLSKWGGPCPSHLVASVNIDALIHWCIHVHNSMHSSAHLWTLMQWCKCAYKHISMPSSIHVLFQQHSRNGMWLQATLTSHFVFVLCSKISQCQYFAHLHIVEMTVKVKM